MIVIVAVFFVVATYWDWFDFGFIIGSFRLNHWFVWVGAFYIASAEPVYAMLKRRCSIGTRRLLGFHVFGNMIAFFDFDPLLWEIKQRLVVRIVTQYFSVTSYQTCFIVLLRIEISVVL